MLRGCGGCAVRQHQREASQHERKAPKVVEELWLGREAFSIVLGLHKVLLPLCDNCNPQPRVTAPNRFSNLL